MLYCLYGGRGARRGPSLLTAASWKAFLFYLDEINLRLLFIWGKRKKEKIYLAPVMGVITVVDLFDCQLLVTVI